MKRNLICLAIAGVFGLTAISAVADDAFEGSWYVMPTIGAMHADGDLHAETTAPAYGIRLGKQISEHWDVQVGGSYSKADSDNSYQGLPLSGDYKQTLFGVDALYMFSRDQFRPFLLAGLGYARNDIDYRLAGVNYGDNKSSWMASVGLGAQYFFNDRVGLQADLREVWSRSQASATVAGTRFSDKETVANTYFNLGLIINFPPPPKAMPVAYQPMKEPVSDFADIAPYDEEPLGTMTIEAPQPQCSPRTETITITAETLFGFDKHDLKAEGKAILDEQVIPKMKAHPDLELLLITGHTDRIGTDAYNQKLSERRANQVKDYLTSQGVDASHLKAVGKSESEPLVDCKGVRGKKLIDCLAPNRRVLLDATHSQEVGC